jgi:pseudomonalisin
MAGVATMPVLASAQPASAWVATATKTADVGSALLWGSLSPGTTVAVGVALKPRSPAAMQSALRAIYTPGSPTYHQFLTPPQFATRYAPAPSAVAAVTRYLASNGFSAITVLPDRMFITATATAANVERAFRTHLASFLAGGRGFFANTLPALVPTSLGGTVEAVLGLNDLPLPTPHPLRRSGRAAGSLNLNGLPPTAFQKTYDAAGTPAGTATTIALFTEGSLTQVLKDLRIAEAKNHLPQASVSVVPVGPQSSDTSGQDEWDLDTQSSTAMATNVRHLYLYNVGSLMDSAVVEDIAYFVSQDKAQAMSASIGECDLFPYLDGSMLTTDVLLAEGAMQGQTFFAASGDNGEGCELVISLGVPASFPGTNWPASGEYVTGVGGTTLLSDSQGNRLLEACWIGSGGGISETEGPGWWTEDSDLAFDLELVTGGRAVPDIALDADPNATPAQIYVSGALTLVGGTSLASPLMLGAWARLETAHANRLGLASIDLYALYDKVNPGTTVPGAPIPLVVPSLLPAPVKGFTNIDLGTNGLYVCHPGYTEVDGLGAPDIAALNRLLR